MSLDNSMKIKVLHVTFDMRIGGTEKVIVELVSKSQGKIDNEIVCLDGEIGPFGALLQEQGIKIHQLNRQSGFDLKLISGLRDIIKKGNYDIIHCHQYTPVIYGILAKRFLKPKIVFTEHGRFYPEAFKPKRLLVNPLLFLFVSRIVSISKATAEALRQFEFLKGRKIDIIYNGIADQYSENLVAEGKTVREELNLPEDAFVFGSVLRFDPIKNIPMMIKAMSQVVKTHPQAHLVLVGGGDEFEAVTQQVEDLNLKENVHLVGYKTHPLSHVSAMDVFLLTSFSEGTAMTLLEAAMLEKPAVVTTVGGNPEIVENGVSGSWVESDNNVALAKAMEGYISNTSLKGQQGKQARERFLKHYESSVMAENYLKSYSSLV